MIYADNAATTMLDRDAFEAMKPYLLENYANASQHYTFSRQVKKALTMARETIAECIGALPEEIYITSGGTESDNWAIKGSLQYNDNNKRKILTSAIEHHAILNSCAAIQRLGYIVNYIPVNSDGMVEPNTLCSRITNDTKLVSVMMANNEIGTIQPVKELCSIAHKNGALFHTDAVQAVGHIPINVHDLDVDMLSASGHKFYAPKGIGFFYIKKGTPIYPYVDGGSQEFGMRAGTENVASIVAMATSLKKHCASMQSDIQKLKSMENILLHTLKVAHIDFIRNGKNNIAGNISLSIKNVEGEMLLHRLDLKDIYVSTGSACNANNIQISHVIKAINVPLEYAKGTIRISFGVNNQKCDAEIVANALIQILESIKGY